MLGVGCLLKPRQPFQQEQRWLAVLVLLHGLQMGMKAAVHTAERAPYSFTVCAQPRKEAIFIPTVNSAALKGQ